MSQADKVSHMYALVEKLSTEELELLRGLVAGESLALIGSRMKIAEANALAMKKTLLTVLRARVTADAVRAGIYAGL